MFVSTPLPILGVSLLQPTQNDDANLWSKHLFPQPVSLRPGCRAGALSSLKMAPVSTNDFKTGLTILLDGQVYKVHVYVCVGFCVFVG